MLTSCTIEILGKNFKPLPCSSAPLPRQSRGCRETRKGRAGSPCGLNKQTFVIISLLRWVGNARLVASVVGFPDSLTGVQK
ncbi:hypothetical protein LC593_20145 [Nostoc sp. CHAB 5844]|nr:hypothetical protein [Nostoc sp. CHAB 5844]